MAESNDTTQKSGARKAAEAANATAAAAKAGSKIASGNIVGGAVEVIKNEKLRNIALGIIVVMVSIPIMMFSLVPNALFTPSEEAAHNGKFEFADIVNWFHSVGDWFHDLFYGDDESIPEDSMIDDSSLQVAVDRSNGRGDGTEYAEGDMAFNHAPRDADDTMTKMMNKTKDIYEVRHKKVLEYIEDDFNIRKNSGDYDGTVSKIVMDPLASGVTSTDIEAARLMSLYSVQTDGQIKDKYFKDYLGWLGDEKYFNFFSGLTLSESEKYEEGFDSWYKKPIRWYGDMLPQKQFDEVQEIKSQYDKGKITYEEYKQNLNDYKDYSTSAVSEILIIDPTVNVQEYTDTVTRADGSTDTVVTSTVLTYTIKARTVDDICNEVVKFDEAIDTNPDGTQKNYGGKKNRSAWYKELVGPEEKQGVVLDYFGIARTGAYTTGSLGGNGRDIVQVAINEIGVVEVPENCVKYNDWYYGGDPTSGGTNGGSYPWCAAFVSWCANECGYIDSGIVPKNSGCAAFISYYQNLGRAFRTNDPSYTPVPGDFVIRGGGAHIGIVEKYENGVLYTIEGNSGSGISDVDNNGGCVARHAYGDKEPATKGIEEAWFGWYCHPDYPNIMSGDIPLGAICYAFETGGQTYGNCDPWYCEDLVVDGAGINYGMMSTNGEQAQNMYNYIISNSENFRNQIGAMALNSAEFISWWKGPHSEADTAEMMKIQAQWTWQAYGEPVCTGEFTFLKRSLVLQEMAISRGCHRGSGGAKNMLRKAGICLSMTDREIIEAVYNYEAANIKAAGDGSLTESLRGRMVMEKDMILKHYF